MHINVIQAILNWVFILPVSEWYAMADSIHGELCPSAAGKRGDCRFDYGGSCAGA